MRRTSRRRIVSEEQWPDGQEINELAGLLRVFECDDLAEFEDRLFALLPEDPGDVSIYDDGSFLAISTAGVDMWSLPFPISATSLDGYLYELDERMTLQTALWELPDEDSWEAEGQPSIFPQLVDLFRTTSAEFAAAIGEDWRPLDLDWVGSASQPSNYLLVGTAVVALDNANAYLFRQVDGTSALGFEFGGREFEEVRCAHEIWRDGGPSLGWITSFVLGED